MVWENGWDGHEQHQLRRLAELSLADKLEWLEEADRLVRHLSGAGSDIRGGGCGISRTRPI